MFEWIGFAAADLHYVVKVYKELRSKKEVSSGDLVQTIRHALEKRDIAIRVHVENADDNTDKPFSKAIDEDDIPDYTVLLTPSKELKAKIAYEMFSEDGRYGHTRKGASFITSELILVPGSNLGATYRSMFVLGRMRKPYSTGGVFLDFKDIPLSDLIVTQCFVDETKKGISKCYQVSPHRAYKNLLQLTQAINAKNSIRVGIRDEETDRFGDEHRIWSELNR
jgi:hypothetical protein